MAAQMTFKRYELKYLLTSAQKQAVLRGIEPFMELDRYGRTTIRSIYCDTENFRLVRRSVEKPAYKEKLRLRSYQQAQPGQPVFVELKKKYRDVVYKRRLALAEGLVAASFAQNLPLPAEGQIAAEIEYFRQYYGPLRPAVFLSYEREAYYALDGGDLRITFDENILFRCRDLSLCAPVFGSPILPGELTLMEIKTPGGLPLSLAHLLAREKIFKTSFSKYGEAYRQILHGSTQGGLCYAWSVSRPVRHRDDPGDLGTEFSHLPWQRSGHRPAAGALLRLAIPVHPQLCGHHGSAAGHRLRGDHDGKRQCGGRCGGGRGLQFGAVPVGTGLRPGDRHHFPGHGRRPGGGHGIYRLCLPHRPGIGSGERCVQPAGFRLFQAGCSGQDPAHHHSRGLDYTGVFDDLLREYAARWEQTQVKTTNMGGMFRLTYNITLSAPGREKEFIDKLRCRNGNLEISLCRQETALGEL